MKVEHKNKKNKKGFPFGTTQQERTKPPKGTSEKAKPPIPTKKNSGGNEV
jgi:hypothetical protein